MGSAQEVARSQTLQEQIKRHPHLTAYIFYSLTHGTAGLIDAYLQERDRILNTPDNKVAVQGSIVHKTTVYIRREAAVLKKLDRHALVSGITEGVEKGFERAAKKVAKDKEKSYKKRKNKLK